METFVIEETAKVDGQIKKLYHQKIELNNRKDVMNVYTSHSVSDKKKALRFYDKNEAERMAKFLERDFVKTRVVKF